jgi:urocanate hydratase
MNATAHPDLKQGETIHPDAYWVKLEMATALQQGVPARQLLDGCHSRHRIGRDIDVRNGGFRKNVKHRNRVTDIWTYFSGGHEPVREGDHLHFPYRLPNRQ